MLSTINDISEGVGICSKGNNLTDDILKTLAHVPSNLLTHLEMSSLKFCGIFLDLELIVIDEVRTDTFRQLFYPE